MKAAFNVFCSSYRSTPPSDTLPYGGFEVIPIDPEEVCAFVSSVGPEHLISVTTHGDAVAVWYWDEAAQAGGDE